MKTKDTIIKTLKALIIPCLFFIVTWGICTIKGIQFFASQGNWVTFFRAVSGVCLTTFALSINLNSGRFDFSIGSISLLSSIISSLICINLNLGWQVMILLSILFGAILGFISGFAYVNLRLPAIIVSLGISLLYEGIAFTITKGYGVSFVTNKSLTSFPSVISYLFVIVLAVAFMIFIFDNTKFGYEYKALLSGQEIAVNTGIKEVPNAVLCYTISGGLMGIVGFISATNTGTIQMALNFSSIGVMFTAFLPMFIGGYIGRFINDKIGYLFGAVCTAFVSLSYARLKVDSSVQQIITALILVGFLIFLNNEQRFIPSKLKKLATN